MKLKKLVASAFLCLMLAFSIFADGDTPNGGRYCDPNVDCSQADSGSTSSNVVNNIIVTFSQIVSSLVK